MSEQPAPGMKAFTVMWIGQLVSLIGSSLTSFALSIWILKNTASVTNYTLAIVLASLPGTLIAPFAGAWVDRWNRKLVMMLSDAAPAIQVLVIAWLIHLDKLEVWHIYIGVAVTSICQTFQWPAYIAAITMLVPRTQYGRVNGMLSFGQSVCTISAPFMAGALLTFIEVSTLLVIDFATFLFAVGTLMLVKIPNPPKSEADKATKGSIWKEIAFGWHYIVERKGLLNLLLLFAVVNLAASVTGVALMPMVLGFSNAAGVGLITSMTAVGTLLGGALMTATGGPKKKIYGVVGAWLIYPICWILIGIKPSLWLVGIGAVVLYGVVTYMNSCSQAIWQAKVEPGVQGRVFAMRRMFAQFTVPIGDFSAGPLADKIFNPMLVAGGSLSGSVGSVIGVGPGRGIAFMYLIFAIVPALAGIWGLLNPHIRNVETELPDHSVQTAAAPPQPEEPKENQEPTEAAASTESAPSQA